MTTDDNIHADNYEAQLAMNFLALTPEDKLLTMAFAHRLAHDELAKANGARLAQMTDRDLQAIAYLFDLSLDALVHMREKAQAGRDE